MNFTVVTAASSNHFKSVCQFLNTVPSSFKVVFYDIGLSQEERENIILLFPSVDTRSFDFSKYPEYVHLTAPSAGSYAWKPIIIHEVFLELNDGILLWCDAGNKLDKNIRMLESIIVQNKIYTPTSGGNIQKWCHSLTLQYLNVPNTFLQYPMRNAAFVGIRCNDEFSRKFINEWKDLALTKDAICPEGSSRSNHRQDQSLLSCLFYKYNIPSVHTYIGFTIQNDIG